MADSLFSCYILHDFQDLSEVRLEVEGEEVGGQILPHFYCEDMMNVMNKVKIVIMLMRNMGRLLVFGNCD